MLFLRIPGRLANYRTVNSWRRLPHLYRPEHAVFLTWRLHDSLPPNRPFAAATVNSGRAFAAMDRLLDVLATPYDHGRDLPQFSLPGTSGAGERPYRTFCGT